MINRKILVSGISILSALALMGGTAFALFTSAASNNGNTFGAGTLVLNIKGVPGSASTPVYTITNGTPGTFTDATMDLSNTGSIGASSVQVTSIGVGGNATLQGKLLLTIAIDNNNNGVLDGGDAILGGPTAINDSGWTNFTLPGLTLPALGTAQIVTRLSFDSSADDSLQGQSANFNINLQANQ
ncbi:MAG: hypothetical protein COY68_02455 [Candidatus Levybacteria bacterium CG_4_10_14_0_8_um_filter_35_23]|nr:MAG: hypothetical protein COY68_02455 [Candidatus Levybacteria bacterium CG_4_10_14_0_8_um_filter_35_23]